MRLSRQARGALFSTAGYFVVLELMLIAAILYWPQFRENTATLKVFAAPVPVLSDMVSQLEEKGVMAYVIGQHFFKGCRVLGVAAATLFAAGAVAGEAHRGTLEVFLARPVSRARLLTERYAIGALQLCVPIFLTTLTVPYLLGFVDETASIPALMLCALHESLFLLVLYSATFLVSTFGRMPLKITFVMLIFAIFNFAIYMVKEVTHYSLFRKSDIDVLLRVYEDGPVWGMWAVFALLSAGFYVASRVVFARRVP